MTSSHHDRLGPLFNANSCLVCHRTRCPAVAAVSELRAGVRDALGRFEPARVPIAHGKVVIEGRTLINDRAICPMPPIPIPRSRSTYRTTPTSARSACR